MQIIQESERLKVLIQEAPLMDEDISCNVKSTIESMVVAQVIVTCSNHSSLSVPAKIICIRCCSGCGKITI